MVRAGNLFLYGHAAFKYHVKYSVKNEKLQLQTKAGYIRVLIFATYYDTLERLTLKCH